MAERKRENADIDTSAVQKQVDQEEEQGFRGVKVDPRPNSDYSLESGPESPRAVEDPNTRTVQLSTAKEGD